MSIRMKSLNGATSCNFDGDEYVVDAEGFVDVPEEATIQLNAHGFVVDSQSDEAADQAVKAKRASRKKVTVVDEAAAAQADADAAAAAKVAAEADEAARVAAEAAAAQAAAAAV